MDLEAIMTEDETDGRVGKDVDIDALAAAWGASFDDSSLSHSERAAAMVKAYVMERGVGLPSINVELPRSALRSVSDDLCRLELIMPKQTAWLQIHPPPAIERKGSPST